ncbi:hypothetical protein VM1G_11869 [Cytospora mali]|uniref:Uncharacterized protein n=1 Tax=Cytospora mali TaxID=578113 RepID=A0A194W9P8_CYTMA|nr:hypothetical protein VM1G_11869 [Valsa mali]
MWSGLRNGPDFHLSGFDPLAGGATFRVVRLKARSLRNALMAPLAAFTMATVLFVWTRSSIQAAKVNRSNKVRQYENEKSSNAER